MGSSSAVGQALLGRPPPPLSACRPPPRAAACRGGLLCPLLIDCYHEGVLHGGRTMVVMDGILLLDCRLEGVLHGGRATVIVDGRAEFDAPPRSSPMWRRP